MTWDQIQIGAKLTCAAHRSPGGCGALFGRDCHHAACYTPATTYTVTGKRRAPKGNRLSLQHPDGWGCSLRLRPDGSLPSKWSLN